MHNYGAGSSSQDVQYQGYPYLNPVVLDVPSISAEAAAKWSNLPRKPIGSSIEGPSQAGGSGAQASGPAIRFQDEPLSPKLDPQPTVFIDLPQGSGSDVAEQRQVQAEDRTYVENTIFYDPFKDRRIAVTPDSDASSSTSSVRSAAGPSRPHQSRPVPPNTLNLGASGGFSQSTFSPSRPIMPASMAKEAEVYGQYGTNEEREFPPAYTEFDTRTVSSQMQTTTPSTISAIATQTPNGSTPATSPTELPRTQVIVAASDDMEQKLILCHNCNVRGQTLLVKETGVATHVAATAFFLVALIPMTIIVYYVDWFKYKNYYCKNCNKKIAYEIPYLCQELTYVQ